jgi:hypothetical protein
MAARWYRLEAYTTRSGSRRPKGPISGRRMDPAPYNIAGTVHDHFVPVEICAPTVSGGAPRSPAGCAIVTPLELVVGEPEEVP